ncbi:MAG: hypothetical protein HFJ41_04385 [Clostridia bacterium]|nr:hypothetical protein [Clostridia bacterium]
MKEKNIGQEKRKKLLPVDKLDKFIEYVSNISLEKYKNKILQNNTNVLP